MNKQSLCNNCGKTGHLFHQCKNPITSYGIIAFRKNEDKIEYLMIRRKDTFSYIEFVRGKYILHNKEQIVSLIEGMTQCEKEKIINSTFDQLWIDMWGIENQHIQYKREELGSQRKFNSLKQGIIMNGEEVKLDDLIKVSLNLWEEPEWEFPKGRKNYQERDIDCAVREFEEETGYKISNFSLIENMFPLEEIFIASNNKSYKHKYYMAFMKKNIDILDRYQKSEVSKIEWKSKEECLKAIRPYNSEKKDLIEKLNYLFENSIFLFSTY